MEVVLQPPTRSPDTLGPCLPLTAAPPPLWQGLALRISVALLLVGVRRAVLLLHQAERTKSAPRAGVRTKVRMRESLARSRCSHMVKNKPLSIEIDLSGMLANIHTVCRVSSLIS